MQPDELSVTNDRQFAVKSAGSRSELDALQATCRRQALVIDMLSEAVSTLRRGAIGLKAENVEQRAATDRARRHQSSRSGADHLCGGERIEVHLTLDVQAPEAARKAAADCLRGRVTASMLDNARLLVTELVTNSLRRSGASACEGVVVRVELTRGVVYLEVEDPGRGGKIAPRSPVETGGFGLNLMQTLSERWGIERAPSGRTRVWVQLTRGFVTAASPSPPTENKSAWPE